MLLECGTLVVNWPSSLGSVGTRLSRRINVIAFNGPKQMFIQHFRAAGQVQKTCTLPCHSLVSVKCVIWPRTRQGIAILVVFETTEELGTLL